MHKSTKEKIQIEINNLEKLLNEINSLYDKIQSDIRLTKMELYASAAFLHSFYNGIEKILLLITENQFNKNIKGDKWHKKLLIFAKEKFLTDKTTTFLEDYMAFRHFFRHAYTFQIKNKYILKLLKPLKTRWRTFKKEINNLTE